MQRCLSSAAPEGTSNPRQGAERRCAVVRMLGARPAIGCVRAGDLSRSAEGVVTRCRARGFRHCGGRCLTRGPGRRARGLVQDGAGPGDKAGASALAGLVRRAGPAGGPVTGAPSPEAGSRCAVPGGRSVPLSLRLEPVPLSPGASLGPRARLGR